MKERTILFPFDELIDVNKKVNKIISIVGADNINKERLSFTIPEVTVRCNRKQWKEIKFKLGLIKCYY